MVAITYFELKEEMDELFDENMVQIAHALAVHDFSHDHELTIMAKEDRKHLKGEEEFLIQIWDKENLAYSSLPALKLSYQGAGGVRTVIHDGEEWRYYGLAQNDWLIQISQPIPERHSVIQEIYLEILMPLLLQLPILLGVIWFFVGVGFKPLHKISSAIKQRSSTYLEKIPDDQVPEEVAAMVSSLNDLLERLENALKMQRRFTGDAAHELRTPLTAVSLQLDILRRSKTEDEKQEAIAELQRGVDRSVRLIRQLLELAHQDPEAIQTGLKTCDLTDVVNEVFEQYRSIAQSKNIEFDVVKNDKAKIKGDKEALMVMIGNLVNNALLYTPDSGKVHISLENTGHAASLKISDNGPGIPEQEKNRIFDRFYRIVGTDKTGSGLGLSIVKTIVERHKGSIAISEGLDGRGASFTVLFPHNLTA